ncbi:MAG TPA: hypothetical protein VMD53_05285 [Rhizomicrobium sp.]|nr:hypothetical protein [Rhizomicrobium sp.]
MTEKDVHFEVFLRPDPKASWALHDASSVREKALSMAADLIRAEKTIGVKVVKESYDGDTGDYLSRTIFEDGHTRMKLDAADEDALPVLPCFKPEDLYSQHARATLARLLRDFLIRHKLTVTELIHRADSLTTLEMSGTVFQHAVQKVAVAQASSSNTPVQQLIKALNDLAAKAMARVQRDAKRGYFPTVKAGGFGALAVRLAGERDGAYIFNGALALRLKTCSTWNEKLLTLLAIIPDAPADGAGRALFMGSVDAIAAEIISGSVALRELIGESESLGQALTLLVDLFLGVLVAEEEHRAGLDALAAQFACDELPLARIAAANRIIAELKSGRRLCPASRHDELALLRKIANRMLLGDARYLSHDNLVAAFTLRSRRLVSNEAIQEYLSGAPTPDDKVERLLAVEENIVGASNKKQLALILQQTLSSPAFAEYFINNPMPVMVRLRRLADLQARARRANFRDETRAEFADRLDLVASEVESRGKVLKSLQENLAEPAERVMAVLKLCMSNTLTEGRVRGRARDMVLATLAQPGFLKGYLARRKAGETPEHAMTELAELLQLAGISPEDGMKSIAA